MTEQRYFVKTNHVIEINDDGEVITYNGPELIEARPFAAELGLDHANDVYCVPCLDWHPRGFTHD